jgi:hypothetical protein
MCSWLGIIVANVLTLLLQGFKMGVRLPFTGVMGVKSIGVLERGDFLSSGNIDAQKNHIILLSKI